MPPSIFFRERPYLGHLHFREKFIKIHATYGFHKPAPVSDGLKVLNIFFLISKFRVSNLMITV